jgi:hypothetical protein
VVALGLPAVRPSHHIVAPTIVKVGRRPSPGAKFE